MARKAGGPRGPRATTIGARRQTTAQGAVIRGGADAQGAWAALEAGAGAWGPDCAAEQMGDRAAGPAVACITADCTVANDSRATARNAMTWAGQEQGRDWIRVDPQG